MEHFKEGTSHLGRRKNSKELADHQSLVGRHKYNLSYLTSWILAMICMGSAVLLCAYLNTIGRKHHGQSPQGMRVWHLLTPSSLCLFAFPISRSCNDNTT